MSPRLSVSLVLIALVSAGLACGSGTPAPDTSANARATGLAQTAAALLTSTAAASVTPATATAQPSDTPAAPPTATATNTLPPPPPATTAAPPPPACTTNDSDFVADVNVPDGTHFAGGTTFNKTWRLRNSGACTWTTAFQLRYVAGEALGGGTVSLTAPVPPGATTDITVAFTAPTSAGTYTSRWQLFTDTGTAFGTKPYVQIKVP